MKYIDVGGGLAVDYDGSFTDTPASMSYTIQVGGLISNHDS